MLNKDEIIKKTKIFFRDHDQIIAVYLFGSLAKGTFNKNSDIDIAVMFKDYKDEMKVFDIRLKLMDDLSVFLDYDVDIIVFSQASLKMQHQIISGELIVGKDNRQRIRREQYSLNRYLDMKYYYNSYEKNMGKGL